MKHQSGSNDSLDSATKLLHVLLAVLSCSLHCSIQYPRKVIGKNLLTLCQITEDAACSIPLTCQARDNQAVKAEWLECSAFINCLLMITSPSLSTHQPVLEY